MYYHARESTVLEWAEPRRVREVVEEWTPYRGKRGGEGWQWSGQGRPIYQKEKPTRRRGQGPAESGQAYDAEPNRTVPDTIRTSDTPESLEKQGVGGESGQIRTDPDIASEIAKLPAGHLDGTRQNPLFANSARGVEGNWQADPTHAVVPIAQIISSQPVVWDKILGKSDAEIVAVSHGDQYVLIDGNHAVVQALLAGETTVPVTVYPEKRDATFDASTPRGTEAIQRHVESWTPEQKMADWKAHGVRGASFKSFFGDWEHEPETASKVVDQETGEPLVVVHGSPQEFDEFRYRDLGFHFGSKEQAEHLGEKRGGDWKTRQFYLDIRNPLRLPDQILWGRSILDSGFGPDREDGYDNSTAPQGFLGRLSDWKWRDGLGHDNAMGGLGVFTIEEARKLHWDIQDALPQKHGRAMSWNEMDATQRRESLDLAGEMVADALRKKGYDGIVYYNKWEGGGGDSWIAFEPQQIKAVENRGTFDPTPNMYESRGRVREQVAFEAWDESKYRRDEGGRFASKDAAIAAVGGQDIGPDEEVEVVVDGWVSWTGPKREADQMVRDQWDETQDLRGISIHRSGQGPRTPERVEPTKTKPAGVFRDATQAERYLIDNGIADRASLFGMTGDEATAAIDAVQRAASFGGYDTKLNSIQVVDEMPVDGDIGGLGYSQGHLYITRGFLEHARTNDRDAVRKSLDGTGGERNYAWQDGYDAADSVRLAIAHELGHHLDTVLMLDTGKGARDILDRGGVLDEATEVKVSGYASTHPVELFAEVHAFMSTGRESKVPSVLREWYELSKATAQPLLAGVLRKSGRAAESFDETTVFATVLEVLRRPGRRIAIEKAEPGERWITLSNGTHVRIRGDGTVTAGFGKGKKVTDLGGKETDIGEDEPAELQVGQWVPVDTEGNPLQVASRREQEATIQQAHDEGYSIDDIRIHRVGKGPREPRHAPEPKPTHTPAGLPIAEHPQEDEPGGKKWRDPPEVLYHATFSAPEIEQGGFKPLNELDPRHRVLGGSDITSMSLTTKENAELYRDGLATARQLAQGQVPWERHNAQLLAHHFGVRGAEFDRLWAEQDRRVGVPDDQRWYDLMQGVSFAGRKFPLFITGGWSDTLKNAPGPPRLIRVARGSAEQFSYNPGETEWKVLDPEKLRVLGVESAVVAATATPRRITESFDETKVKRDDEGQFAKQERRSSVNSDTSAIADKAPISDSGPESSGDPKKPRPIDTPEFKRWFGKSKVVGEDGEPLVVYHGTSRDFDQFEKGKLGTSTNTIVNGFFFTDDPEQAGEFAIGIGRNVKPVFLSLQNPMVIDADGRNIQAVLGAHEEALARDRGHDGFIVRNVIDAAGMVMTAAGYSSAKPTTLYIAFEPEQIKSAISNRGTYDPKSPKITESTSLELSRDGQIRQITTRPVARESQAMSLREAATGLARALVQQTAPPEPDRYLDAVVAVARRVSEFCNVQAAVLLQRHIDPAVFGPWKARPIKAQESVSWQRAPDVLEEWTRYEGERGGKGWQWNGQGEPRYQEEKPSEPGGESSNIQPGPANRQEAGPSGATPPVAKPEGGKMTLSQQMLDQAKEQHGQWPDQGWDKVADTLAGLPDAERAKVDAYLASGDFKNRSKKLANRIKSGKTPIVPMNEDEQAAAQQAQRDAEAIQRAEAAKKEQERIEAARKREEQRKADLATTPLAQKESGAAGWVVDKRGTRLYVTGTRYGDPTVDRLRQMGAHWDKDAKAWWIGVGKKADLERLVADVNQHKTAGQAEAVRRKDEGLAVKIPYEDTATREQAKKLGARWDAVNKQWLLPNADAKAKIDRLLADAATKRQEAASRARAEADKRESDARKAKIPAGGRMFSKTTDLRGQGYGVGNAIKDRDGKLWIVTDVERPQRFEDGLSMGMGRDDGYEHTAYARPATPEEAKKISFADRRAVLDKELRILSVGPDDERDREAHNQRIAAALKAKKELDEEEFSGLPPLSGERAERAEEVRRSVQKAAMQQIESAKSEWSKEEAKWSQRALEMLAAKDADWWLERSNNRPQTIIADMTDRYRHGQKIVLSEEEAESLLTGEQRYSLMDHYAFGWDEDGNFVMWDNDQTKDEIPKAVRAKAGLA